jgi:hypothetical protein
MIRIDQVHRVPLLLNHIDSSLTSPSPHLRPTIHISTVPEIAILVLSLTRLAKYRTGWEFRNLAAQFREAVKFIQRMIGRPP